MKKQIVTILFASIVLVGCATQPLYQSDSGKPETTPSIRFEVNRTNGTAIDTITKLKWKVCAEGQSYSEGHCTGNATSFTWDNAMQTFGDKGDNWRLPNEDELNSIVEGRNRYPAINMAIFPDALSPRFFWRFWSASPYDVSLPTLAWDVNFGDGSTSANIKSSNDYVRLVRGEQWFDPLKKEERNRAELAERQKREAEQAAAQQRLESEQAVAQAEKDAYVSCDDKTSCDKAFSLTQIYVNSMASQKIQVATDTIVETYNPTENGNIGMKAVKIPGKGSSAVIRLTVMCKIDDSGIYDKLCGSKKLDIYNGFRPFVKKMLSD
jgi:hypothetical protein